MAWKYVKIEFKKEIEVLNTKIIYIEYETEELKLEVHNLKIKNQELKKENKELKKEIVELKEEIVKLKDENKKHNFNKLKYKIITAIQDAVNKL